MVGDGKPAISRADSISDERGISELVQCSPVFVLEGKEVYSMPDDTLVNARTFVACDGKGHWLIGTAKKMTLSALAAALVSNSVINEIRIKDAMNLDGGPSTGLRTRQAGKGVYVTEEGTHVQNIVIVLRR